MSYQFKYMGTFSATVFSSISEIFDKSRVKKWLEIYNFINIMLAALHITINKRVFLFNKKKEDNLEMPPSDKNYFVQWYIFEIQKVIL